MSENYLIAGLGNPGREYTWTRHNLGFLAVEKLAEEVEAKFRKSSLTNGLIAETKWEDKRLFILMPLTFMNNSGLAIRNLADKKEIDLKNILVVCDDVSLPFREMRLRPKGSSGGHNGLKSIIQHLGTNEFARLRLGVGHPGENMVEFVLGEFNSIEKKVLNQYIDEAKTACLEWLNKGTHHTMELVNRRKEHGKE